MKSFDAVHSIALVLLLLYQSPAAAETLILVPGYLGDAQSWRQAGFSPTLERAGWSDGGNLRLSGSYVRNELATRTGTPKRFYTVSLPTDAPLLTQAGILAAYIDFASRSHPDSELLLVGHSAGGVVARLYMVQHPEAGVTTLITIASPHRGTESAELGLLAGHSPLAWVTPMLGLETFNRSQGLYYDLVRENPRNILGWLNRQPHPWADYIAVVRTEDNETYGLGDLIVPPWSQDMSEVFALHGRADTIRVKGRHGLQQRDAELIAEILALRRPRLDGSSGAGRGPPVAR